MWGTGDAGGRDCGGGKGEWNVAFPARMVLWQHVGDFRPLSGSNVEKRPIRAETRTWDPELLYPTASH